jgi:hypothetical protein
MDYVKFKTINPETPELTFEKRLDIVPKTDRVLVFQNIP